MNDPWICPYCYARFPVPSMTAQHIRETHPEEMR